MNIELKKLDLSHATQLFLLVDKNREYLKQWLTWLDSTKAVIDSENFILFCEAEEKKGTMSTFGIWNNGQLIGMIDLHYIHKNNRSGEVGYWVAQEHSGKGVATRATELITKHGFDDLNLHRIQLRCATDNPGSAKVARKLGFTLEATLRECEWLNTRFHDHFVFAKLRSEA